MSMSSFGMTFLAGGVELFFAGGCFCEEGGVAGRACPEVPNAWTCGSAALLATLKPLLPSKAQAP
eukprot:4638477-Alexandrium_andersonii.AAC.1